MYASYSNAGIKGIIDKPADRTDAIKALIDKAGGKLLAAFRATATLAEADECCVDATHKRGRPRDGLFSGSLSMQCS